MPIPPYASFWNWDASQTQNRGIPTPKTTAQAAAAPRIQTALTARPICRSVSKYRSECKPVDRKSDFDPLRSVGLSDEEIVDIVLAAAARCFLSKTLDALGVEADARYAELDPAIRD